MALSVEWTPQAEKGLDKVLEYLEENGMEKEILNLEKKILALTERISKYPKICPQSHKHPDLHKGLVGKNYYIIYRVRPAKEVIEIINFRGTRQRPLE